MRKIFLYVAIVAISVLSLGVVVLVAGARINTTKSIPLGLYWTSKQSIHKGAYVMFCPPPSALIAEAKRRQYLNPGFCRGGYGYLMKKVMGVGGDQLTVNDEGVAVNGVMLPLSRPRKADGAGRPLPHFQADHTTIKAAEVLVMSDINANSFDSRYYGPIERSEITSVITPVFTW